MKKNVLSALVAVTLASGLEANAWKILPVLGANYTPDFAVALTGGFNKLTDADDTQSIYGVEVSLNCPLLSPPTDTIRQRLSITNYDYDGLSILSVSLNPHHMFQVADTTTIGFGPSLGVSTVDVGDEDDVVFTYGLGASLRSDISDRLFVGVEARYELTQESDIVDDLDNTKVLVKLGYQF